MIDVTSDRRWDKKDWLVLLGLLAFTVVVWSRVLFKGNWSFGVEVDFIRQFYPARFFAASALGAGHFPMWDPYILCGHPFFASYQTAMLYPFNLLMVGLYGAAGAAFPLKAQCVFVVFHFYLAGVFTYLLGRELKIGKAGSAVAAVTFMLCGYMVAHSGHLNQQSAAAWIPLVFLLFHRCLERRKYSYAVACGAVMGVALLAGHLQPFFYMSLFLLLFVVFTAILRYRGDARKPGLAYGLGALATAVVIGGALACVQLIPTLELIRLSSRRDIPYSLAATYSLPRKQLLTLVFPHLYGSTVKGYTGLWTMWEVYGYAGIVSGALAVTALLKRRRELAVFLWVALVLSVILALGPGGYLFTALFKSHLLFNRFRDPARVLVIFGFCLALLAGMGTDRLKEMLSGARESPGYRTALKVACALLALVLLLAAALSIFVAARGSRTVIRLSGVVLPTVFLAVFVLLLFAAGRSSEQRKWLPVCLVVLVALDLVALNVPWTMVRVDPDNLYHDKAASEYIAGKPGGFRVETDANSMYSSLDNGALYGLDKASGDDSLVLQNYFLYRELVTPSISPGVQLGLFHEGALRSPLLDLMNDVYFISRDDIKEVLWRGKFDYLGRRGGVNIYRNLTALPRAWISDARVVADDEAAYERLKKGGAELRNEAVVVAGPGVGAGVGESVRSTRGDLRVRKTPSGTLIIETAPSCRGLLVTSEVLYPGWEAYVDGKKKEIVRTNFLFRGVMLTGGQRKVVFRFRSGSFNSGLVVSALTLALLALYLAGLMVMRRRSPREVGGQA